MGSKSSNSLMPMVEFMDCLDLEVLLKNWFGNDINVCEYMGLLLFKLGVLSSNEDSVSIFNYNRIENSFTCMVNKCDYCYIKFRNLNLSGFNPLIEVRKGNEKNIYECIPIQNIELNMRVYKIEYMLYRDKMCLIRNFSFDSLMYCIDYGKYVLEFGVSKPDDISLKLFDGMGNYSYYKLENEDVLVDYLKKLKFPVSIIDVYEKICEISLGDVSRYSRMFLKIYKRDKYPDKRVIDLIHLNYGNLIEFGMNIKNRDRTIFIDDTDKWCYECIDSEYSVKISGGDDSGVISYNISVFNRDNLDDVKRIMEINRANAYNDVGFVKKLTKEVFNRRSKYDYEE